jgi:hypothetical protein
MTRTMGDATHASVAALAAAGTDMAAGYVTGGPAIMWTAADWARFAGRAVVTIDQGFTGSPVMTADVRDVEAGAWTAAAAVNRAGWTAPRPTVYCSASLLPQLAAAGWRGDVWVADYISQAPGQPYPVPAGMNSVAWQWTDTGGGGAYDLSVVFDPAWPRPAAPDPKGNNMNDFLLIWGTSAAYLLHCAKLHKITPGEAALYQSAGIAQTTGPVATDAEIASLLADFPPGNPAVTVPPVTVTVPPLKIAGTIDPA